jgi:hypothetical protein
MDIFKSYCQDFENTFTIDGVGVDGVDVINNEITQQKAKIFFEKYSLINQLFL